MENPYAAPQSDVYTTTGPQVAPLTWKQVLFSFEGRIPRRTYWGFSILIGLIQLVAAFAVTSIIGSDHEAAVGTAAWVSTLWPTLAIGAKRWHDRAKSGSWNLLIVIQAVVGIFAPTGAGLYALYITSTVAAIWVLIQCGCLRGTVGPNQYGGDPT